MRRGAALWLVCAGSEPTTEEEAREEGRAGLSAYVDIIGVGRER